MAADDASGDQAAGLGAAALAPLERVQGLGAQPRAFGILFEPGAHLAIEVPAQVVERFGQGGDLGRLEAAEIEKADHHIGQLHAGVVDVVLHLHRMAEGAQQAGDDVAEHGVSQVADVGRLVGIDVGVLDDHLLPVVGSGPQQRLSQEQGDGAAAIEEHVEVAGTLDPNFAHELRRHEARRQLLADRPGRLLELASQVQRGGKRQIAELAPRRDLHHWLVLDAVELADPVTDRGDQLLSKTLQHGGAESIPRAAIRRRAAASPVA